MNAHFPPQLAAAHRNLRARAAHWVHGPLGAARLLRGRLTVLEPPASESGMTMIEVIISTLLVGIIAIGTLTGFDTAGHATADEQAQAQAAVLAAQDEERLHGLKATQIGQFGSSSETQSDNGQCIEEVASAWRFCEGHAAYRGTVFTVKSSADYVSASQESLTCKASPGSASYLKTTSEVTWPTAKSPVKQSNIVNNPLKVALVVKVRDEFNEPVEGATVKVTGTSTAAEQTTSGAGCVIFGALTDKSVVTVSAEKSGWVDHQGVSPPPSKVVTVSASTLTEVSFTIAPPGGITAEFESNGAIVSGESFVAEQNGISEPSGFVASAAAPAAKLSMAGLFPFATPGKPPTGNPYLVYAGDCEENNPAEVIASVTGRTAQVNRNSISSPSGKLELPPINLTVKSGTKAGTASEEGTVVTSTSAKLINTECVGKKMRSGTSTVTLTGEHPISVSAGKLEPRFQPYAKTLELCVVFKEGSGISTKYYKNKTKVVNAAKTGSSTTETFYVKRPLPTGLSSSSTELKCP
jgi:type II secretory pathway pseudopilin PulG